MKKLVIGFIIGIGSMPLFLGSSLSGDKEIEWIKYHDAKTGHEIWQLTNNDSASESLYFYAQSFTSDDRYVIFRSKRSGVWDAYRCDLRNGELFPLTHNENLDNACIHPDGKSMAYISGWKYFKLDVHSLKKELVVDFAGKLSTRPFFRPTFSQNGKYTLVFTGKGNTKAVLYRVNLESGELVRVLESETGRISHEQINPVDPNLITFVLLPDTQNNMNLPMNERSRTRLIKVDQGTQEPFLIAPYGFRATHDSWSPQGDRFFFFEKTEPGWTPASIASINLHGRDYTRHYTDSTCQLGHGTVSRDGKWFISDGQKSFSNPLLLLNLEDRKTRTLCWPDASVNTPARVHVHPNFSSSGNFVIFTSDRTQQDRAQVYVMPIKQIIDAW